jgi:hypothetical protein
MLIRATFTALATAVVAAVSLTPFRGSASTDGDLLTDTIPHNAALIGSLERAPSGQRHWLGGIEPRVGAVNSRGVQATSRGLISFDISQIPSGSTIVSATLRVDQCATVGSPFATFGAIVVDHLLSTSAPDSATYDTPAAFMNVGTLSTDAAPGFRAVPVTAGVIADFAALRALAQFRLRFSAASDDATTGNAYVAIRTDSDDDCPGFPDAAPVLIVAYRR